MEYGSSHKLNETRFNPQTNKGALALLIMQLFDRTRERVVTH